jgi:hypothetical protein
MAYELRGQFLEACDCHVMCPCWFASDPDESECTGMVAWRIEQGQIDEVDVSGLAAVSVSYHEGNRQGADARVVLYVDERATDEQLRVLAEAFTGRLGGPLAELAELTEEVGSVRRAPISFTADSNATRVSVGQAVAVTMSPIVGANGRVVTVTDGALATMLGGTVEAGRSTRFKLDLGGAGPDVDLKGRGANRGSFAYVVPDQAATTG